MEMTMALLVRCLIGMLALSLAGALAGSAEAKSLDDIIKQGVIRIGIQPNFPPFSSRNAQGEFAGFDVDIGNKIAEVLKVKPEWVPVESPQRVPFLVADKIDIMLGALTRTAQRAQLIEYTVPLHTEVVGVLTTDKVDITDWKQLDDPKYTLSDMRGNWEVDWLKRELPNAKMALVDTVADEVRQVAQGRADAIVGIVAFVMPQAKTHEDVKWKVLQKPIEVSYDAIGVGRGNYPLRDALNIALYDMHASGFVNERWEKWFASPMLVKIVPNPYF
jgi:polar amino acid transport system substrate-binding protein